MILAPLTTLLSYVLLTVLLLLTTSVRHSGGDWFAPDGKTVGGSTAVPGFRRSRGPMVVRLLRNTGTDPPAEGIYDCVIEDDTLTYRTTFVGLYNSGGSNMGKLGHNTHYTQPRPI